MCWQFALCLLYVGTVVIHAGTDVPDVPVGHLQKLGSHRPMEGRVEVLDKVPHPIDFYEQYSAVSKPVILKGAARDMPAFKRWTDEYMKEKYGNLDVQMEPGKKENRTRVALDGSQTTFGSFLDLYNNTDVYMVDSVPQPMEEEMMLLKCLLCGGYTKYFSSSNMWFSSGGTKSVLHNDDADNINCVISGQKEFFMAHKKYEKALPFTAAGHVPIDVDAVDLIKTPGMKEVKWWLAEVEAGDCLFIPYFWLHQVRSTGRNLAVNIWWHFFYNFNYTDCLTGPAEEGGDPPARKDLPQYKPFSTFEKSEGESHRKMFIENMHAEDPKKPISLRKRDLLPLCVTAEDEPTEKDLKDAKTCAKQLMKLGDTNGDKMLDVNEMYAIDSAVFLELFGEPSGGYSIDDVDNVRDENEDAAAKKRFMDDAENEMDAEEVEDGGGPTEVDELLELQGDEHDELLELQGDEHDEL